MHDVWAQIDGEILGCLLAKGPMAPHELAREIGVSEGEATALLATLAREGKIRIRLVEATAGVAAKAERAARRGRMTVSAT